MYRQPLHHTLLPSNRVVEKSGSENRFHFSSTMHFALRIKRKLYQINRWLLTWGVLFLQNRHDAQIAITPLLLARNSYRHVSDHLSDEVRGVGLKGWKIRTVFDQSCLNVIYEGNTQSQVRFLAERNLFILTRRSWAAEKQQDVRHKLCVLNYNGMIRMLLWKQSNVS